MNRRMTRVNALLQEQLSELLVQEIKDPRLGGVVSITGVDTSVDLQHARISVSVLGTTQEQKHALAGLRHAARFLRRELAHRVKLKRLPELHFVPDDSIAEGARVLGVIDSVSSEGEREGEH